MELSVKLPYAGANLSKLFIEYASLALRDPRTFIAKLLSQRWIRFGLVGVAATVSYFLLGLLFVNVFCLPVLCGNALAYILSFAVSYLGQSRWTFEARGSHANMLPKFAIAQGIGFAANSFIVWLCVSAGLVYELAMVIAIVLVPVLVYFICKYWVFAGNDNKETEQK